MRAVRALLGLLLFKTAVAQAEVQIYPLNLQGRFEQSVDQDFKSRFVRSLSAGFFQRNRGGLVEIGHYKVTDGNSYSGLEREHVELMGWFRQAFAHTKIQKGTFLLWVGAVGGGIYQESITTSIEDLQVTDSTGPQPMAGVSLGPLLRAGQTFRLSLEGRVLFAQDFLPNPQPDVVLRTGFAF